jgi:tetratricopeptide (TPR) repeat protein
LWWLILILVVAAVLRVQYARTFAETPFHRLPIEDAEFYHEWAERLAAGESDAEPYHMAPLSAHYLSVLYRAGLTPAAVATVHGLLGVLAVAVFGLAAGALFGAPSGRVASAILAVYGPAIFYEFHLLPFVWTLLLPAILVWALARWWASDRWRYVVGGALAAGFLVHLRGNVLLVLPAVVAAVIAARGWRRRGWAAGVLVVAVVAVIIAPVTLHNVRAGQPLLLTWHGGQNAYIGNHAGASGLYESLTPGRHHPDAEREDARRLAEAATGRSLTEREIQAYWVGEVWRFMRDEPGAWSRLQLRKLVYVLDEYEFPDAIDMNHVAQRMPWLAYLPGFGVLLSLALAGMWASRREVAARWFVLLMVAYLGSVVAFFVFGRYRLPAVAFLAPFAARGVVEIASVVAAREWRRAGSVVVPVLLGVLLTQLPSVSPRFGLASSAYNLGRIHELASEFSLADEAYAEAVGLNPQHVKATLALSRVRREGGTDPVAFLSAAEADVRLRPSAGDAWAGLGHALLRAERPRDAERAFRRALSLAPRLPLALEGLNTLHGTPAGESLPEGDEPG